MPETEWLLKTSRLGNRPNTTRERLCGILSDGTFAGSSIWRQFMTGWTFAFETSGCVDAFTSTAKAGSASALVDICESNRLTIHYWLMIITAIRSFVRSFKVDTQSVPANLVDLFSQLNKSWFNIFTFLNLIMWQSGFDQNGRQQLGKIRNHFEVVWRFLGLFQRNWQEIESVLNQFEGDFKRA